MKTIEENQPSPALEFFVDSSSKKHELTTKVAAITGKLQAYHSILNELNNGERPDIETVKSEVDWVLVRLGKAVEELREAREKSY